MNLIGSNVDGENYIMRSFIQGLAIKKPDYFYDSFPATSMMRRVGH
jgi:hypothetical protein